MPFMLECDDNLLRNTYKHYGAFYLLSSKLLNLYFTDELRVLNLTEARRRLLITP